MTRTLPSGSPRTDTLSSRAAAYKPGKSVAAPLVRGDARNLEVLPDLQPVNADRDLAVLARLLDPWTQISVSQSDAVFVAARRFHNLTGRDTTLDVDPVAPPPTVGSGRIGDLLAVAV